MSAGVAYPSPNVRRLRIFSFDPALAAQYDLAGVSGVTIEIPWEANLKAGPVGEYIEVVDIDPGSEAAYAPVDLNAPELLATDGLAPSESDPRFHQQMVYAVAMKTIEHFERALGRKALWSSHRNAAVDTFAENYVPRLRIYPHALRQQNAYYSPLKKALLFGYFACGAKNPRSPAGSVVFTCLSHDIIAHETTHALLDGVHPRFNEPVNEDVLAFHEAFADIVALFQHFSYPGVLRDQIARTRGDLARESMLGQLAQQFALASGRGDALRSYLGSKKDGEWQPTTPDPALLGATSEPHDRGAILVAAVFGAFMKVYRARTRDLFRIASEGTGIMREGDIHPDLVNRLAEEAQRCAERALQMCIRAIDYCPPVGIRFGSYLRAIVTADHDMNPTDQEYWRLAFIESFREWGISPLRLRSMAEDSLLWPTEKEAVEEQAKVEARINDIALTREDVERSSQRSRQAMSRLFRDQILVETNDEYAQKASRGLSVAPQSSKPDNVLTPMALSMARHEIWLNADKQAALFHSWLMGEDGAWLADALGLLVNLFNAPATISVRKGDTGRANVEIHSVRTAMKRGLLGFPEPHMVVVITQWRAGFFDRGKQAEMDSTPGACNLPGRDFKYRAGCTLLIDPEQMGIRRVIRTPGNIADEAELDRMRHYLLQGLSPPDAFSGVAERFKGRVEPFAFLHSHAGD